MYAAARMDAAHRCKSDPRGNDPRVADTARKAFVATVVAGSVVVLALALWKLRILLALVFLAFIIAAAMRPGIDALARRRCPRSRSTRGATESSAAP